jgi:lipoprotein-releasing system permease protein
MKTDASVLYAFRLLFPRTGKKSNARRSLTGAFLCIAVSLIPLVMIMSVSNGMVKGMTDRMIGLSSSHLCAVLHPDIDEAQSAYSLENAALHFSEAEGVLNVYPEVQSTALAASSVLRTGACVRAVENDIFSKNKAFSTLFDVVESESGIDSASDIVLEEGKNAVIGSKIAQLLNLHAGDDIRLITTRILSSNKIVPKVTKFHISAIVSSGYQELDALWVFIPLKTGYSILPLRTSQIMIGAEIEDPFSYKLDQTLEFMENIAPPFTRIYRWNELNVSQYENFSSTQIMLLFIMLLIVLVASVNISSALVMLVMERRKEIAILKSLGASPSGITFSFLVTGMVTGFLGVFTGIPIGLLCAVNFEKLLSVIEKLLTLVKKIFFVLQGLEPSLAGELHILDPAFYLQKIPLSIPLGQLIIIALGTLVLSLAASAVPAVKAGREKPIESLRKL